MRCQTFSFSFFPCSADHERDWPPCKVVFFGLATNALNVRNNNNNNTLVETYQSRALLLVRVESPIPPHTAVLLGSVESPCPIRLFFL